MQNPFSVNLSSGNYQQILYTKIIIYRPIYNFMNVCNVRVNASNLN